MPLQSAETALCSIPLNGLAEFHPIDIPPAPIKECCCQLPQGPVTSHTAEPKTRAATLNPTSRSGLKPKEPARTVHTATQPHQGFDANRDRLRLLTKVVECIYSTAQHSTAQHSTAQHSTAGGGPLARLRGNRQQCSYTPSATQYGPNKQHQPVTATPYR